MTIPYLIIIPVCAVILTQLIKFIICACRGKFSLAVLLEYGGMPSAHTAFVTSLATVVGLHEGINSAPFAITVVFALLTIRDAIGLRQFISGHSRVLNMLIKDLPDDQEEKYPTHITEQLGHTPLQATIGGLIGLIFAWLAYIALVA